MPRLVSRISAERPWGGPYGWLTAIGATFFYRFLFRQLSRPSCLWVLRSLLNGCRKAAPIVQVGSATVTLTHLQTKAALEQDDDFIVANGLADRMPVGPFLMNIDWEDRHAAEKAVIERALGVENEDQNRADNIDNRIMNDLRDLTAKQCAGRLPGRSTRSLNVARDFTEELTLDTVHHYFGIGDNSHEQREELRVIFRLLASQIFQSPPAQSDLARATLKAQDDLLAIALESFGKHPDTVLGRFEAEMNGPQRPAWLTKEWSARNAAALAAFGSGTVARAGTQIVYRLLTLKGAKELARIAVNDYLESDRQGRPEKVLIAVMEALRFNPMLPLIGVRQAARNAALTGACPHMTARIPAGGTVIPAPFIAMFDQKPFEDPMTFKTDKRNLDDYLHFGGGRHVCVGKRTAEVQLEEIVIALFADGKIRPFPDSERIDYDGPAVETYRVRFDA